MSKIFYNNFLIGQGQPDPLVTREVAPIFRKDGRRLGQAENYTLVGVVTGCSFTLITGAMARLNNIFSKDFGTLEFADDDGFSIIKSGVKVNSITYDQGTEVGIQPYTIALTCYPQNFFESAGIIEKRNDWEVSMEHNKNLNITHSIYAKGTNTAPRFDNALDNAKNFVLQYTGFTPPPLFPFFITGFSGSLDSRVENINRLDGTYEIVETYIGRTGSAISSDYTIELQSGTDGIITVTVQGNFKGGKGVDISGVRQAYANFSPYDAATGVYQDYRGVTGLNAIPLSSGVTEDFTNNTVNFSVVINDWPQISYKHDYNVDVTSGTNGIVTTSINGTIEGVGQLALKYDRAYAFFKTLDIYALANDDYRAFVGSAYPFVLRNVALSSGTTDNRFAGTIQYNASFDNKVLPLNCSGIKIFDVTFSKKPALRTLAPVSLPHSVQGLDVVDLGYNNRATLIAQGNVVVLKPLTYTDATGVIARYINNKFQSQFLASGSKSNIKLDSINLTQDVHNDSASFSVQYSFDEPLSYNPSNSYTFITGFFI